MNRGKASAQLFDGRFAVHTRHVPNGWPQLPAQSDDDEGRDPLGGPRDLATHAVAHPTGLATAGEHGFMRPP
jgi:hypothetical protein